MSTSGGWVSFVGVVVVVEIVGGERDWTQRDLLYFVYLVCFHLFLVCIVCIHLFFVYLVGLVGATPSTGWTTTFMPDAMLKASTCYSNSFFGPALICKRCLTIAVMDVESTVRCLHTVFGASYCLLAALSHFSEVSVPHPTGLYAFL